MRKTREILRLRRQQGLSVREAARALGVSVGVVSKTASRAEKAGVSWEVEVEEIRRGVRNAAPPTTTSRASSNVSWHERGVALAAMSSPRFRAAASFSGSPDQFAWTAGRREQIPFDSTDKREFLIRSPLAFPNSFQCSVRLYFGSAEPFFAGTTRKLAESAHASGRDVLAQETPGDHVSHVAASMQSSIEFFRRFEK